MAGLQLEALRTLLDPLDTAAVECDGMARLVVTRLTSAGIEHQAYVGHINLRGHVVRPHFWVEAGGWRIDYRARMWLGPSSDVPHGIVPLDGPCRYSGLPISLPPLSDVMFEVLATPIPRA